MSNCDVCIGTGDYDPPSFYEADIRKARKPHVCCECHEHINPGDKYEHVSGKWDDRLAAYDTCSICLEIRNVFSCGRGFIHGELWDRMREDALPNLTTASECFRELSAAAKQCVMDAWREEKGLTA